MQYHHRSRLPPPPPQTFGRSGGVGYPRGHKQLYAPPPPSLAAPQHRQEVLMEAGRLAAEYLVAKGVLPPSSLQRGSGGGWAAPTLLAAPPPLPPQQHREDTAFYGRKRYEDEYSNNPTRPRRNSSTSSGSSSSRDDYSTGSYNGRGKRKYGDYRRGNLDCGREREKDRGRPSSNGRRYEDNEDEDGAPGFWRERRGSGGNDDARNNAAEASRNAMPLMGLELGDLEIKGTQPKAVNSTDDVKAVDALQVEHNENEEGEMKEDDMVLSSEREVVKLGMDTNGDVNNTSVGVDMEAEACHSPDGKIPDVIAEDGDKVLVEPVFDTIALDDEATNLENNLHGDERNLLKYVDYAKAPTRPRSLRAHRNATSVQREPSVPGIVDLVSSREASNTVPGESANESSMTDLKSENREDQIYQENTDSSTSCDKTSETILLKEKKESAVTGNMIEEKSNTEIDVVKESKEEINLSLLMPSCQDNLMEEIDLAPLTASHNDNLIQDNLTPLTVLHKRSLIEETNPPLTHSHEDSLVDETSLPSLTVAHKDILVQETGLSQMISSHDNNLKLQFKEGCDIDMLPEDVDFVELSDQRKTVGDELYSNVGAGAATKMEENLDQSNPFEICNRNLIGGTKFSETHNPGLVHYSTEGSSTELQKIQQQDFVTTSGDNVGGTDTRCQLPLDFKAVQVIDIEDDTPMEVGGFDSSKAKSEIICSSMDNLVDPVVHSNDLPGIQDGYNLAISDFLSDDIPCYTSMQSDLHAGIVANDSEVVPVMDDPIYGSLTDIGFMDDVWGQPTQDYGKFF